MKQIDIYTTPICPFCIRAKRLLSSKGVDFNEIDVMGDAQRRAEMMSRANGGRTVPQIFIGDVHVGGSDDLAALEQAGRLDALLAA
ncbi:MAG: glutaredoxin 3 [Pseudomonadota bacterium]